MKYTSKQKAAALADSSVPGKEQGFVAGLGGTPNIFLPDYMMRFSMNL